jgi:hypothetical protein
MSELKQKKDNRDKAYAKAAVDKAAARAKVINNLIVRILAFAAAC